MKETGRLHGSGYGAFIVDRSETILGFDRAMESLTGWPAIDVVGRGKGLAGASPDSDGPLYEGAIPRFEGSKGLSLTLNCRDGRRLEVEAVADRLTGPGERIRITTLSVVSRSARDGRGRGRESRDSLTGLPGTEAFAARLHDDYLAAASTAQPLALVLLDVDHLREINDQLGHAAGDDVLQKLAGILRVSHDDELRICRLADDDFAILMPGAGRGDARQLAASLRSTVARHRFFAPGSEGAERRITLSIGAASFPADADSESDLVDRARDALGEARAMGRNRVWCYLRRPRVPLEVPVYFDGSESLLVGYTRDLSPSGLFVQTSAPIDIGMRCALTFPLPGKDGKVHVIARVVRTVPTQILDDGRELRVPGMGIEFEKFSGTNDRRAIESYLHRNESKTLRPENGILST